EHFLSTYGDPVYFSVAANGAVTVDPALAGVLTGGLHALTVHGVSVTVDATALPGTYTALDYTYQDTTASYQVNLLPGQHLLYTYGDPVYFSVAANGAAT